jgi:hypothetical protein
MDNLPRTEPPIDQHVLLGRCQGVPSTTLQNLEPHLPAIDTGQQQVVDRLRFLHTEDARPTIWEITAQQSFGGPDLVVQNRDELVGCL